MLSLLLLPQLRGDWLEEKRDGISFSCCLFRLQVKRGEPDISIRRKVSYVKFD